MENQIIYIYNKEGKFEVSLNYSILEFKPEFYSKWEEGMVVKELYISNPILDGDDVREMTREELILINNQLDLLEDGEYVYRNKIRKMEKPTNYYKAVWDREKKEWIETATKAEIKEELMTMIQVMLDNKAKTYGFDSIVTASTYLNSKVEQFKNDSNKIIDWRDEVWAVGNQILLKVLKGEIEVPTYDEVINQLPTLEDGEMVI